MAKSQRVSIEEVERRRSKLKQFFIIPESENVHPANFRAKIGSLYRFEDGITYEVYSVLKNDYYKQEFIFLKVTDKTL